MDRQEPLDRFDPEERHARARLAANARVMSSEVMTPFR